MGKSVPVMDLYYKPDSWDDESGWSIENLHDVTIRLGRYSIEELWEVMVPVEGPGEVSKELEDLPAFGRRDRSRDGGWEMLKMEKERT